MKDLLLLLTQLLIWALLGQIIISWLMLAGVRNNFILRLNNTLAAMTEPLLRPIRRVVPSIGVLDLTFFAAFIILFIVQRAIIKYL